MKNLTEQELAQLVMQWAMMAMKDKTKATVLPFPTDKSAKK